MLQDFFRGTINYRGLFLTRGYPSDRSDILFMNPHFHYTINSDVESKASLLAIMKEISLIDMRSKLPDYNQNLHSLKHQAPQQEEEIKQNDTNTAGTKMIQSIYFEEHKRLTGENDAKIVEAKIDTEEMQ